MILWITKWIFPFSFQEWAEVVGNKVFTEKKLSFEEKEKENDISHKTPCVEVWKYETTLYTRMYETTLCILRESAIWMMNVLTRSDQDMLSDEAGKKYDPGKVFCVKHSAWYIMSFRENNER